MCDKFPVFRERLNQLLTGSGQTIVAFAKTIGTSRQSLGYYLNGKRIPDAKMIRQICERCHVSADWLCGLSDVRTPDGDVQSACKTLGISEKLANFLIYLKENERSIPEELLAPKQYDHWIEAIKNIELYMGSNLSKPGYAVIKSTGPDPEAAVAGLKAARLFMNDAIEEIKIGIRDSHPFFNAEE